MSKFDCAFTESHNGLVRHFRTGAAIALLGVLLAGPCLGVCTGWSSSHHERMACCAGKAQDEADACCASGEGRRADSVAGLLLGVPAPQPVAFAVEGALIALPHAFSDVDTHRPITSRTERHVLLSVFLI